ncbi:LamG domain-containing protein [bacterium]|nr:LamG domain-containing protein [bacterium]
MKLVVARFSIAWVSLIVISLIFIGQSYAKIDAKTVVGVWLFDEGNGNTTVDSSKNGHDGEIEGNLKWVEGKFGKGLEFPGVDENFVKVPHNKPLDLTTFSFTLWVKITATGSYQSTLIKTEDCQLENYSGYIYAGRKVFWTRFTSGGPTQWGFQQFGTTVVTDDEWHHLAGTYDMKSVKSYIDGVVEADAKFDGKPDFSPGPLNIGDCPGFSYPVKGIMDDVGLFNVALTEKDINDLMKRGLRETATAVSISGKLANVWGNIKVQE